MPKRVALGLSGGVDSSLSAALLIEQGYEVTAVFLECWRAPGCRTDQDRKDALQVALQLGIPFKVLDFKHAYKDKVVESFFAEYEAGRTPNPDVACNKEIKFGLFYDWAMAESYDYVATGHYAQILDTRTRTTPSDSATNHSDNKPAPTLDHSKLITSSLFLVTPTDAHKDQTYFLYRLRPDQLPHILFPIGHLLKTQVRAEAKKRQLKTADKKDSVGICFIGDINVHSFLKERLGENPGDVINPSGQTIGQHQGLWFYTVGQRHGFNIFPKISVIQPDGSTVDKHNIPPCYVIGKNPEKNQLVVGFGSQALTNGFSVTDLHWIMPEAESLLTSDRLTVRIRHTGSLHTCRLNLRDSTAQLTLNSPIQGVASGQSAVFYLQNSMSQRICLGGGIIDVAVI